MCKTNRHKDLYRLGSIFNQIEIRLIFIGRYW